MSITLEYLAESNVYVQLETTGEFNHVAGETHSLAVIQIFEDTAMFFCSLFF